MVVGVKVKSIARAVQSHQFIASCEIIEIGSLLVGLKDERARDFEELGRSLETSNVKALFGKLNMATASSCIIQCP